MIPSPLSGKSRRLALTASVAAGAILGATLVDAVEQLELEVEKIEGTGWRAEGVAIRLNLPENGAGASATVARLTLGDPQQTFANVRIDCPEVEVSVQEISCEKAVIAGKLGALGMQAVAGRVRYARTNGDIEVRLNGLHVADGRVAIDGSMKQSGWNVSARIERMQVGRVLELAHQLKLPVPQLTGSGVATGTLTASGVGGELSRGVIAMGIADVTVNNEEGSLATEKLSASLHADVRRSGDALLFNADLKSSAGQAYAQPIFLDFGAHALSLSARGVRRGDELKLEHFALDHRQVAEGQGSASLDFKEEQPLRELRLKLAGLRFPGAYTAYLQPMLLDTSFKSMTTSGALSGDIEISGGSPRKVDLRFDQLTLDDGARRLVIRDLTGDVHWLDAGMASTADNDEESEAPRTAADSTLQWSGGALLNLDLGPAALKFRTQSRQMRLLEPSRIPLLDGALDLESLRVRNAGLPSVAFIIDATIQPISAGEICKAFGWPEFGGKLEGKISKLRVRQRVATLGTTLEARVFDGIVKISDLKLDQPFSAWPRFYSNIALENLDLALVTSAFSFGGITGRLSGDIKGLELFNWSPVAFDAKLHTPANDRSQHRISQRAVENIGSIGGGGAGVTAALSSGVLRFFENFNYERLGFSCRLENDVCHLDGVEPAPNGGYYLVKGKGLPRIDVIGGARRVDWPRLVQQLIAATESGGPVVD